MSTTVTASFQSTRKFYDDKNYPRGISRSGDYSIKEFTLLENHGVAFIELSSGIRKAETPAEERFIKVCRGELEASTKEELTWLKYQTKVLSPKQFHTLFGNSKVESENEVTENEELEG